MLALVLPSVAAPRFVAEDPRLVQLADRAWAAATACAGREAPARAEVRIKVGDVGGGFEGRSYNDGRRRTVWRDDAGNVVREVITDEGGLYEIRVTSATTRATTIAHEVAHAWVNNGPSALVEGATRLLEACISGRDPVHFPPDTDRDDLSKLEDLRTWKNPDGDPNGSRSAGYAAAARMFAALAEAVPPQTLWRTGWTWESFDAVLGEAGEVGVLLRGALAGGVDAQRLLLGDPDRDGEITLREHLLGTYPYRWDSDGDGWWDGAPPAVMATSVALPPDRSYVCSGRAAGPLGALVSARGGSSAGDEEPPWLSRGGAPESKNRTGWAGPGTSILMASRHGRPAWASAHGVGLVPDRRCVNVGGWTVLAGRTAEPHLEAFAEALGRMALHAGKQLGDVDRPRVVLWLGGDAPDHRVSMTTVPEPWLRRGAGGEWDYVAAWSVAQRLLSEWPVTTAAVEPRELYEAFARTLAGVGDRPAIAGLVNAEEADRWLAFEVACPGGWREFLEGACGTPEVAPKP